MTLHTNNNAIPHSQLPRRPSPIRYLNSLFSPRPRRPRPHHPNPPTPTPFLHLQPRRQHVLQTRPPQLILHLTPTRSVVTWTALISGLVHNSHFAAALLHFANIRRDSIHPNDFTFPCAFKAAGSLRRPVIGKQVHVLVVKAGQVSDVFVGCSAFDMYCKTGLRDDAGKVFDEMPERNLATSNAVMEGRPESAVEKFVEFVREGGEPNSISFCAFLNACSEMELGRQLHGFLIRFGFGGDVRVSNGLVDFYGKCRDVASARMVFDRIGEANHVSWCSMVAGYVQNHEEEKVL